MYAFGSLVCFAGELIEFHNCKRTGVAKLVSLCIVIGIVQQQRKHTLVGRLQGGCLLDSAQFSTTITDK